MSSQEHGEAPPPKPPRIGRIADALVRGMRSAVEDGVQKEGGAQKRDSSPVGIDAQAPRSGRMEPAEALSRQSGSSYLSAVMTNQ
ncbi:hypothetical protein V5F53_10865 [Xanthobacter sp. V4C-4]|uniref:hypothetical protein n=1 Tax=Xanthobacter cornucopiae TaxID=3119924 RepID=UPI003729AF0A